MRVAVNWAEAYNIRTFTSRAGDVRSRFRGGSAAVSQMERRGPQALSEILGTLFAVRGYNRLRAASELEDAWNEAIGEPGSSQTRVGGVRHGVLSVTVAHSTLLEELAAFRKPDLLAALRRTSPGANLHDIRFRVGPIDRGPGVGSGRE